MTDLYSEAPPVEKELAVFIHVFVHKEWKRILDELLEAIQNSGLHAKAKVHVCYTAQPTRGLVVQPPPPWMEHRIVNPEHREWSTLRELWQWCHRAPDTADVLYLHTKGVYRRGQTSEDWRRMMTYFCVERWREAIFNMRAAGYDAVGCNLKDKRPKKKYLSTHKWDNLPDPATVGPLRHFSGNFWWARASSVRPLLDPLSKEAWQLPTYKGESKWLASERWIGECKSLGELHHSGVCHYSQRYERWRYVVV